MSALAAIGGGCLLLLQNAMIDRNTSPITHAHGNGCTAVRGPLYAWHLSGPLKESLLLDAHSQRNGHVSHVSCSSLQ